MLKTTRQDETKATTRLFVKKKKIFFNLLLLLSSVFLSLIFIEIYLIKINYPYQGCETINQSAEYYLGDFDDQTGWSYKKSISYYDNSGRYEYHFNGDGIRVSKPNHKIDYAKPIILFIGGSVTFGEELNYKDTFPSKINDLLDNKFEVINLGVQGFSSDQSMLKLRSVIEELGPQYVVYTFIPDHINRNGNYDRRLHVPCFEFSGTKPVFSVRNNALKQIRKPQRYGVIDKFKLPLFIERNYQNFKEKQMLENGKSQLVTRKIIDDIGYLSNSYGAKDYYIYYDTTYDESQHSWNNYLLKYVFDYEKKDRVLNFTNWAEDSQLIGEKYYVNSEDNYHPNATISADLAKRFVDKFGEYFNE